jgi:dihydroorotate dehydrogenase
MRRAAAALAQATLPLLTRLDPEFAHDIGLKGLRRLQGCWPPLKVPASLSRQVCGLHFIHPVGLAAGFDKNGDYLDALGSIGFSHVELGTVTPRPQPGNPKPRMFRFPADRALVNRMGFNNKGVDHLVERVQQSRYSGIRGISIGKNFDTPLEKAQDDYVTCLRKVHAYADYVAINVSSPNTARLRELQSHDGLQRILGGLLEERSVLARQSGKRVPLLVKVAPDLDEIQIDALAKDLSGLEIDGVIATNTTINHALLRSPPVPALQGGLSGMPLHATSLTVIRRLRAALGEKFPIIGVGGISSGLDARATLNAGANLIQIYTGFAYRGAALLQEILAEIARDR